MIINAIENFVLFSTVLALLGSGAALLVRWFSLRREGIHPHRLARIYAAAITLPPVASFWLVCAAFLPKLIMGEAGFAAAHSAPLHELHLIGEWTSRLEPGLGYFTLTFFIVAAGFALVSAARGYWRVSRIVGKLDLIAAMPSPEKLALVQKVAVTHHLDVGLVMSSYPFSFVWGFGRSKLLLSSGTLCTLNEEELAGVLEHEATHHRRRDNLVKLLLNGCVYSSLAFPLSRQLMRWRGLEVELVCDEVAAGRTRQPIEIAAALVKLQRETLSQFRCSSMMSSVSSFASNDSSALERRVRRLLELDVALPGPAHLVAMSQTNAKRLCLISLGFAATLSAIFALAPLAIHDAAESLINLFS